MPERVDIQEVDLASSAADCQLLAVNEALDKLAAQHKVEAELVKLRYFVGMTNDEAAEVLGISPRTAKYFYTHARVADLGGTAAVAQSSATMAETLRLATPGAPCLTTRLSSPILPP